MYYLPGCFTTGLATIQGGNRLYGFYVDLIQNDCLQLDFFVLQTLFELFQTVILNVKLIDVNFAQSWSSSSSTAVCSIYGVLSVRIASHDRMSELNIFFAFAEYECLLLDEFGMSWLKD